MQLARIQTTLESWDIMTAQQTAQRQQRGAWAKNGATYWAAFQRIPSHPILGGSHYGTRVDCAPECDGLHGHVFTSEAAARARLAILPTHYTNGGAIVREVGRVLYHAGGYFYDVLSLELSELRPGMRVNVGASGTDYWQTVESIEYSKHVGGRQRGADVYSVTWGEVVAADPAAAPSMLSSRSRYDVLRTDY